MRKFHKHISCLILLFCFIMMQGQELPSLGVAPEIKRGNLPDGIQFYLVTNPDQKGFADFALVQRGRRDAEQARSVLRELPHFGTRKPYQFLADHGIGYSAEGFISLPADAALYTFHDVPTYDGSVADSTLLMLFDIAAEYRKPQAVIVCGDIDAARIQERMGLLSMMVPSLEYNFRGFNYTWQPQDSLALLVSRNTTRDVAAVHAIFRTQRLPKEVMNTPQPLVTQVFSDQLDQILRKRVARRFRQANIPLAAFRYRYDNSAKGPDDERHSISIYTSADSLGSATRLLASVLSSLDGQGAGLEEFRDTKERIVSAAKRAEGGRRLSNAGYLDKCVASYLYGANLASEASLNRFIVTRRLDDERELELFNGFTRALLDSTRNLTLRFDIPERGISRQALLRSFQDGWAAPDSARDYKADFSDTLSLYQPRNKVKLKADAAEPISGGRLWTFSNGIKVIFKKMNTPGEFRYALMLRGSIADVPGLQPGESAFVGDMLALSDVAGLNGNDFREMLGANGITMQTAATLSDLRLTGIAPKAKLPLLLRALLSVSDRRLPNPEAFSYYKAAEALRIDMEALSPRDVNSQMDSIMRPSYQYTERKRTDCLGDDLPRRAEQYFATLFDKTADGIFVLMGDLNEDLLKKELCRTLGDFRTQKGYALRPRVENRFATGSVTRTAESAPGVVGGGEIGVNVAMSAAVPFSLENYMSFKVACAIIRKHLTAVLADQGAYVELSDRLELFPAEQLSLFINCRPCRESGLPAGVVPAAPPDLLDAIRQVTHRLTELPLPEADLRAYTDELLKLMDSRMNDAQALIDDVLTRYSEGKDLVTDYKTAVGKVSTASVAHIISLLRDGAEVEYLII